MQGMVELGEEVFHMRCGLGLPGYAGGLSEVIRNPALLDWRGLLMAGLSQHQRHQIEKMQSGSFKQIFGRMKKWFETNF